MDSGMSGALLREMVAGSVEEGRSEKEVLVGDAIVAERARWVVSSDGGGGREASTEARQRKHSPLPK
jgi:hypothetical protein